MQRGAPRAPRSRRLVQARASLVSFDVFVGGASRRRVSWLPWLSPWPWRARNQTAPARDRGSCVPSRAPGLPKVKGALAAVVGSQRRWLNKFPACNRATLAAAQTSLAKGADRKVALDGVVVLRGHLSVGYAEFNPVLFLDADGKPSKCQPAGWRWDLVLCGGERIEIQLRGSDRPTNFTGNTCTQDHLQRHPLNVVVSGKLKKSGLVSPDYLRIEDAKMCWP